MILLIFQGTQLQQGYYNPLISNFLETRTCRQFKIIEHLNLRLAYKCIYLYIGVPTLTWVFRMITCADNVL